MQNSLQSHNDLVPHLFRLEYAKMTAVLCRHFGLKHLETAEDIASETFLMATEVWSLKGIPQNPTAWLYSVAKNKTRDYLRRHTVFETRIKRTLQSGELTEELQIDFTQYAIADSQLAMIFAVCHPANSPQAQISLALQILCGFSVEEIARAFLAKTETIKKRLLRARANLRNNSFQVRPLEPATIQSRLDTVLTTLYLLFNEGYLSKSGNQTIRKDLCSEAIRLALILTENPLTNTPTVNALLALLCFQSSRLQARISQAGESVLYEEQNKDLWSQELIGKGNFYLVNACQGNSLSKYHLEAAIAYWHTTPSDQGKWKHILQLYNELILIEYSPITALNRTFAFAKVYGNECALPEAEKLKLLESSDYHALLGYLSAGIDPCKAKAHYRKAITLTKSSSEKKTLSKAIEQLDKNQQVRMDGP